MLNEKDLVLLALSLLVQAIVVTLIFSLLKGLQRMQMNCQVLENISPIPQSEWFDKGLNNILLFCTAPSVPRIDAEGTPSCLFLA